MSRVFRMVGFRGLVVGMDLILQVAMQISAASSLKLETHVRAKCFQALSRSRRCPSLPANALLGLGLARSLVKGYAQYS